MRLPSSPSRRPLLFSWLAPRPAVPPAFANGVMGGPRPGVRRIPVAGIAGHALVENAVWSSEHVARRPVRVRAGAVHGPPAGALREPESRVDRPDERDRIVQRNLRDE